MSKYDDDEDDDDKDQDESEEDDSDQDDNGDDQTDEDDESDDKSDESDQSDQSNESDASEDGAQAVADAEPHEVEAHRNMIGDALQHLSDRGIDVASLAEKAGVSSTDVDQLSHGDLAGLTKYIADNHPEALSAVGDRFPAAHGLLDSLTGGGGVGGMLGKLFGR